MTLNSGFERFQRDLNQVMDDLDDLEDAKREASEQLAEEISAQAPVLTGFLAGSVVADGDGVGVGAPYAVFVRDPYIERGIDAVDWLAPFNDAVDAALTNLQPIYL